MHYSEIQAPQELAHLAKAAWTLSIAADGPEWVTHVATPDGCIELIHRIAGSSHWQGEQPRQFVAGLITGPAELRIGAGSVFLGLRLWPWAWNRLAPACPSPSFVAAWRDLRDSEVTFDPPVSLNNIFDLVPPSMMSDSERSTVEAVLASPDVAGMAIAAGRSHRWLQRWFEREVGVPPRTYVRLLRFNETFAGLASTDGTLADHAAAHGFADQAHMAREFRRMSGQPALRARRSAKGPFLPDADDRSEG